MPANHLNQKIYIAGHRGMVGSAIIRELRSKGYSNLVVRTHEELDLTNQAAVEHFFETEKPDQVYLAAAKVGGIHANNTYPAEFIYQNLMIQNNVINQAFSNRIKKLLFLGSSCIYPRIAPQPIPEDALLGGRLEPTNEPYAIAKIAGIKMCESYNRQYGQLYGIDYRSIMPCNLYGSGDNYHPEDSHVIPALIRRFHEAKLNKLQKVIVWGSGLPRREFLHVDDLAVAAVFIMNLEQKIYVQHTKCMESHINVGYGDDITISELAQEISKAVGYDGIIEFDQTKPDGIPRKLINSTKIHNLGWKPQIGLHEGLRSTYREFCNLYKFF